VSALSRDIRRQGQPEPPRRPPAAVAVAAHPPSTTINTRARSPIRVGGAWRGFFRLARVLLFRYVLNAFLSVEKTTCFSANPCRFMTSACGIGMADIGVGPARALQFCDTLWPPIKVTNLSANHRHRISRLIGSTAACVFLLAAGGDAVRLTSILLPRGMVRDRPVSRTEVHAMAMLLLA
jgi:hypothetical protein